MVTQAVFRQLALAMPDAVEAPHFEAASFRAKGKIFATIGEKEGCAVLKLMPDQQEMLTGAEPDIFERIPNVWGVKGSAISREILQNFPMQPAMDAVCLC